MVARCEQPRRREIVTLLVELPRELEGPLKFLIGLLLGLSLLAPEDPLGLGLGGGRRGLPRAARS